MEWAKHQAGVTQRTALWTEDERVRVCQHLSGVMGYVRLLLIDSKFFAEEVEPTGAVPMELSLERYRYAALNSQKSMQQPNQPPLNTGAVPTNGSSMNGELKIKSFMNSLNNSGIHLSILIHRQRQAIATASAGQHVPWVADPEERQDALAIGVKQLVWGAETELEVDFPRFKSWILGDQFPQHL